MSDFFAVDVFTFPSSHHALKAEKICKEAGIKAVLIPLPREISADCGVSLIVHPDLMAQVEVLFQEKGVALLGVHRITRGGKQGHMWRRLLVDSRR
jgi:hypothetical protein